LLAEAARRGVQTARDKLDREKKELRETKKEISAANYFIEGIVRNQAHGRPLGLEFFPMAAAVPLRSSLTNYVEGLNRDVSDDGASNEDENGDEYEDEDGDED